MTKEEKKVTKKTTKTAPKATKKTVSSKTVTTKNTSTTKKATVKTAAKKVTKPIEKVEVMNDNCSIAHIVYMFLLIMGVCLVFVSLTLKFISEIDNSVMFVCLGIALVLVIASSFIKNKCE